MTAKKRTKPVYGLIDVFLIYALSFIGITPTMIGRTFAAPITSIPPATLPLVPVEAVKPNFKVMTYNLKFASEGSSHPWSQRRRLIWNAIKQNTPDLIGTQEGLFGSTDGPGRGLAAITAGSARDATVICRGNSRPSFIKKTASSPCSTAASGYLQPPWLRGARRGATGSRGW